MSVWKKEPTASDYSKKTKEQYFSMILRLINLRMLNFVFLLPSCQRNYVKFLKKTIQRLQKVKSYDHQFPILLVSAKSMSWDIEISYFCKEKITFSEEILVICLKNL